MGDSPVSGQSRGDAREASRGWLSSDVRESCTRWMVLVAALALTTAAPRASASPVEPGNPKAVTKATAQPPAPKKAAAAKAPRKKAPSANPSMAGQAPPDPANAKVEGAAPGPTEPSATGSRGRAHGTTAKAGTEKPTSKPKNAAGDRSKAAAAPADKPVVAKPPAKIRVPADAGAKAPQPGTDKPVVAKPPAEDKVPADTDAKALRATPDQPVVAKPAAESPPAAPTAGKVPSRRSSASGATPAKAPAKSKSKPKAKRPRPAPTAAESGAQTQIPTDPAAPASEQVTSGGPQVPPPPGPAAGAVSTVVPVTRETSAVQPPPAAGPDEGPRQRLVEEARALLEARKRFRDCSSFILGVYRAAGVTVAPVALPAGRSMSESLFRAASPVVAPRPGDIAVFHDTYDRNRDGKRNDRYTHVSLVESVDGEVVTFIHRGSKGVARHRMNLSAPDDAGTNDALRMGTGKNLAGQLFAGFGDLLGPPSAPP